MCESFKINAYFDEKGEELERLIEHLLTISGVWRMNNAWENKNNNL